MNLLLDTHIFLAMLKRQQHRFGKKIENLLTNNENSLNLSVASLWEVSIKWRLLKLDLAYPPHALADLARDFGVSVLPITEIHAVTAVEPEPPTRDPFDRMLLAQCAIENMRLVTVDRALAAHPLSATAD